MQVPAIENFRQNLATVLLQEGISQGELHERTKVTRAFINKVLAGTAVPSLESCDRLAAGVKLPLVFLILDPPDFARIMADPANRKQGAEAVHRELQPNSPKPPAGPVGRAAKKSKGKKPAPGLDSKDRMRIWAKRLLAG